MPTSSPVYHIIISRQVPPLPVRAADPTGLPCGLLGGGGAGEAVHHAGAGPGGGDGLQQLGGNRGEDQALGAAGRPQQELVDQHHEPLRVDVLLRLPGMPDSVDRASFFHCSKPRGGMGDVQGGAVGFDTGRGKKLSTNS